MAFLDLEKAFDMYMKRLGGYTACTGEMRNMYTILVTEPHG
jgi:hypothetical protein